MTIRRTTRSGSGLALLLALLQTVLLPANAEAQVSSTQLNVCNRGSVPVSLAAAFNRPANFFTEGVGENRIEITGWVRLNPGECRNVFRDYLPGGQLREDCCFYFYLGILMRNQNGERGMMLAKPPMERGAAMTPTTQTFCVDPVDAFRRVVRASQLSRGIFSGGLRSEQSCSSASYQPMEFALRVTRMPRQNLNLTYTIRPGPDSTIRLFTIDGTAQTPPSTPPAAPPACRWVVFPSEPKERREENAALCKHEAERGAAEAQYALAMLYAIGNDVSQSYEQAAKWYRRAANQGHANAQFNLGRYYEEGRGVVQDCQQAVVWYQKAAAQGHWAAARKQLDCAPTAPAPAAVEPDRMDSIREENWQHQQRAFAAEQAFREWVVKLFAERYGGDEAGEYARYGFGGAFGNRFTDVLREIFESPKDAEGNLVDPSQFGLDSSIRDPHDAILAVMMREHPAPYALEWLRDETPEDGSIAGAGYTWRALTARFGETAVVEVARMIDQADRVPAEDASTRVADPRALGGWSDRPGQLLHELMVFGSGERFLTALLWHRRDAEIDPHNPRSLPAAQGSSEQLLKAAESVRSSLVEGAEPEGAELSDDAYDQFLAAIQGGSGLHVVRQFERGEGSGFGNLAIADAGTIFGTATQGGPANQGFIFSVNADGSDYQMIHGFQLTGTQRPGPNALMLGPDGALYGTLRDGGDHNRGALYRIETDGSDFTILHHFSDARDQAGGRPVLLGFDAGGTLYGTCNNGHRNAAPRLFRINVDGSGFEVILQPLTAFEMNTLVRQRNSAAQQVQSRQQQLDQLRAQPVPEHIVEAAASSLRQAEARLSEAEAQLSDVPGGALGSMVHGGDGFFYGVAQAMVDRQQHSVIFRLSDDGRAYEILHQFDGAPLDGTRAVTPPLVASDGKLYGFTATGGIADAGVIYRLDRDGSNYEVIFNPEDRFSPGIRPIEGPGGMLYAIGMLRTGPSQPRLYRIARDGGDMTILDEFARDRSRPVQRMSQDVQYHGGALYGWNNTLLLRYRLPHY